MYTTMERAIPNDYQQLQTEHQFWLLTSQVLDFRFPKKMPFPLQWKEPFSGIAVEYLVFQPCSSYNESQEVSAIVAEDLFVFWRFLVKPFLVLGYVGRYSFSCPKLLRY